MPINYNRYPPNWKEIRKRILARAQNRCEFCGISNGMKGKNSWRVILTIAHLDHDPENWQITDDRLKALCQACHLQYDRPRHIYKRKYGSQIFKQPTLL